MKFYDRTTELSELRTLYQQAGETSRMTVITGRRRVGKTMLALEFAAQHRFLYLFISKKSETLLCKEFLDEIQSRFPVPVVGDIRHFRDLFRLLIELAKTERLTVIIDEFQEFITINPAVYSEIQSLWDQHKSICKLNLICIGSVYSLMRKIFEGAKEPLFGRADRIMYLKPFPIATLRIILADHGVTGMTELFDCYAVTGGLPKYLDLLTGNQALSLDRMLDFMLREHSPFLAEGKNLLIEEFGNEYGTYFSSLGLIAEGKTARTEIESILEIEAGAYLARLEQDYGLISRHVPFNARPNGRVIKYAITDNFLSFWFRFIFRNWSAVETGNFPYIRSIVNRDYSTWAGRILERYFHDLAAASGRFNRIGSSWERGNQNEIDLVAINDLEKRILIAEVKLNKSRISLEALKRKSERLLGDYSCYSVEWAALGPEDAAEFLATIRERHGVSP